MIGMRYSEVNGNGKRTEVNGNGKRTVKLMGMVKEQKLMGMVKEQKLMGMVKEQEAKMSDHKAMSLDQSEIGDRAERKRLHKLEWLDMLSND
jgi:hypothetical protein